MATPNPEDKTAAQIAWEQIESCKTNEDLQETIARAGEIYGSLLALSSVPLYGTKAKDATDKVVEILKKCIHQHIDSLLLITHKGLEH